MSQSKVKCLNCFWCKRKGKKTYCKKERWVYESGHTMVLGNLSNQELSYALRKEGYGKDYICDLFESMGR